MKERMMKCSLMASVFAAGATAVAAEAKRPNILFIMSDDHAANAISCYGSRINKTPNIDRIAAEGVRMNRVYATNPICAVMRTAPAMWMFPTVF